MKGSGTGRVTRPALRAGVRSGWIGGLAAGPPAAATPDHFALPEPPPPPDGMKVMPRVHVLRTSTSGLWCGAKYSVAPAAAAPNHFLSLVPCQFSTDFHRQAKSVN